VDLAKFRKKPLLGILRGITPPELEPLFEAIITSMKEKFSLFLSDGTPVRSTVDVTLEQHTDDTVYEPQMQGQGAGQGAPQTTTATEGDRVDNIASANNTDQRTIAEQNNVDDPMNIPPGTTLSV